MAAHAAHHSLEDDKIQLGDRAWPLYRGAWLLAILGLIASVVIGFFADADHSFRRFFFAYLTAYGFFLSIGLGALFFVIVQHLTRAGWSVTVRRIPEALISTMPVLGILAVPLVVSVLLHNGQVYRWAVPISELKSVEAEHAAKPQPAEISKPGEAAGVTVGEEQARLEKNPTASDEIEGLGEAIMAKYKYLNAPFFIGRLVLYIAIWSIAGLYFFRQSVRQDEDGNTERTNRMQSWAPLSAILVALSLTFAAVDLFMSIDPTWYSTMFGVYFFAGCAVVIFAVLAIVLTMLQSGGYLRQSVNVDHYHDIGKFLFGFVFFWGYIAFSQYMLLWYSNIPEETEWFRRHGATTVSADITAWTWVIVAILFGHLLIPFGGLLSRVIKRRKGTLVFWSVWLVVFHYLDIYWVVMPELGRDFNWIVILLSLTTLIGVGGVMAAAFIRSLASHPLRPTHDPRMELSLAYTNA